MTTAPTKAITAQAAGAFGEKAVEAELLRRNCIPANVNASIVNAAKFDIYALKRDRSVQIRVKTCRPNTRKFLCGGFKPGKHITTAGISQTDFTVVVRMGAERESDQYYVVPTTVFLKEIAKRQRWLKAAGKKEIGMFSMYFDERRDGKEEGGRGIEKKWEKYLNKWKLLDDRASPVN